MENVKMETWKLARDEVEEGWLVLILFGQTE